MGPPGAARPRGSPLTDFLTLQDLSLAVNSGHPLCVRETRGHVFIGTSERGEGFEKLPAPSLTPRPVSRAGRLSHRPHSEPLAQTQVLPRPCSPHPAQHTRPSSSPCPSPCPALWCPGTKAPCPLPLLSRPAPVIALSPPAPLCPSSEPCFTAATTPRITRSNSIPAPRDGLRAVQRLPNGEHPVPGRPRDPRG